MIKPTNSQVFGLGDEWPTLSMGLLSATITGVNFNSGNNDNAIFLPLPFGLTRFFVLRVDTHNANHSLTAANFGVFAAPGGAGQAIIAAGTALTVSATANATLNNMQSTGSLAVDFVGSALSPANTIYYRVGTAEGAAATGDVTVYYMPKP